MVNRVKDIFRTFGFVESIYEFQKVRMFYVTGGSGETVLILPGTFATCETYLQLAHSIQLTHKVIMTDIPPFGRSSVLPGAWDFADYAAYFDGFLRSENIHACTVIGHSFGGGIALALATKSSIPKSLILCNPAGLPGQGNATIPDLTVQGIKILFHMIQHKGYSISATLLGNVVTTAIKHITKTTEIKKTIANAVLCNGQQYDITTPVRIIWGRGDEVLSDTHAGLYKSLIPKSSIEYTDGHHNWILIDQEKAIRLIKKKLK